MIINNNSKLKLCSRYKSLSNKRNNYLLSFETISEIFNPYNKWRFNIRQAIFIINFTIIFNFKLIYLKGI